MNLTFCLSFDRKAFLSLLLYAISLCEVTGQSFNDTIHLREVEIIGTEKIPVPLSSVTEIDSLTLSKNQDANLADLLSRHSTVFVKSTGRGLLSSASFRGTDASHTRIYWNGLNLNSAMLGQMDLSLIPAAFMDQVLLYHGGSSLSRASGALGGIIDIETQPDWNRRTGFSIRGELASFGTYQASANLDLRKNNLVSNSRFFFNHSENDYPFYNTSVLPHEEQRLQNSRYTKYGYLQEIYYRIHSNDILSVRFWFQDADRDLPPPISKEVSKTEESQADRNIRSVITWQHFAKSHEFELSSGITADRIHYQAEELSPENAILDSRSKEISFINRFDYSYHLNLKTTARVQILYNYYNAEIKEIIHTQGYNADRSELSMMAKMDRNFGKRLSTWFLLRTNLVDKNMNPVMPSIGFAMKLLPEKNIFLKSNLSRNYNIPTLNDMYWIPGGNPELKPEENYTADLALEVQLKNDLFNFHSSLTGYVSRINDWILWKPTQYQYWAPENVAIVLSRGLELNMKASRDIQPARVFFQANYNLSHTTDNGKQLIYIPIHAFNVHAGVLFKGYQLDYSLHYTGKRYTQTNYEEEDPESIMDPYLLNDLSVSKEFSLDKIIINLRFAAYNLFNKDYRVMPARPMPGRNYSLILSLSF
jgi:iron complex outermembrane receptor protein